MFCTVPRMSCFALSLFLPLAWTQDTGRTSHTQSREATYSSQPETARDFGSFDRCGPKIEPKAERKQQELNIKETLFRHLFAKAHKDRPSAQVLFLYTDSTEEIRQLVKRMADYKPPVKPSSQRLKGPSGMSYDKTTGERGISVGVWKLTWVTDSQVKVRGGYSYSMKEGMGAAFQLDKVDGKWKVKVIVGSVKRY